MLVGTGLTLGVSQVYVVEDDYVHLPDAKLVGARHMCVCRWLQCVLCRFYRKG